MDTVAGGVRFRLDVDRDQRVVGLDRLMKNGTIRGFERGDHRLIVYAADGSARRDIADNLRVDSTRPSSLLATVRPSGFLATVWGQMKQTLVPPKDAVSSDYWKVRLWGTANMLAASAVTYFSNAVLMHANTIVYSATTAGAAQMAAKAATVAALTSTVGLAVTIASSFIAKNGDINPKKWLLVGSLISLGNSMLNLGLLSFYPHALIPLAFCTAITGAFGGVMGGAANVNIANHLAPGNNKGLVGAKNSNQDGVAGQIGTYAALGLMAGALYFGLNSQAFNVGMMCALGPTQAICNVMMAKSLRMEAIRRGDMERMGDAVIDRQPVPPAPDKGLVKSFKELIFGGAGPSDPAIHTVGTVDDFVTAANSSNSRADILFGLYRNEKYLLTQSQGGVTLGFRKDAALEDVLKGYAQARLLQRCLASGLPQALHNAGASDPTLLAELTYNALPSDLPSASDIGLQGWHTNLGSMRLPFIDPKDANWTGPAVNRLPKLSIEDVRQLIATPDAAHLKVLLG